MKSLLITLLIGCSLAGVSCKTKTTTASANPYQNNPYYGPSSNTTNYSSTPASSSYPSYAENPYTPPTSIPSPSVPSTPTYNAPAVKPSAPVSYAGSGSKKITVGSGDTLYGIAKKNGTSVSAIKSANGLSSDTIRIGQSLVIP